MKKTLALFLILATLLSTCLLLPVSAADDTAATLNDKLVVHYDFDHLDANGNIVDTAPAGTSQDTLTVKADSTGVSGVRDGYLHVSNGATVYAPKLTFNKTDTTKTDSLGYDIYSNTDAMTVVMDFQLENTVTGMSNLFHLYSGVRCLITNTGGSKENIVGLRLTNQDKTAGSFNVTYVVDGVEKSTLADNNGEKQLYVNKTGDNRQAQANVNSVATKRTVYALVLKRYNENTVDVTSIYSYDGGATFEAAATLRCSGDLFVDFFKNMTYLSIGPENPSRQADINVYDFRIYNDALTIADLQSVHAEQAEVHTVGYQTSAQAYTVEEKSVYDVRLLATIDSADYVKAGFKVYDSEGYTLSSEVTHCFTSIAAQDSYGTPYTVQAPEGRYYIALTVKQIPVGTYPTLTVIPWVETADGTVLHDDAITVTLTVAAIGAE